MDKRERHFASMRGAGVARLPTMFRSSKVLAGQVMAHFGIDPCTGLPAARALLAHIGADFWASGSRPGHYATFVLRYLVPRPQAPYVEDGSCFYQLGIPAMQGNVDEIGLRYSTFCDPPLTGIETAGDPTRFPHSTPRPVRLRLDG